MNEHPDTPQVERRRNTDPGIHALIFILTATIFAHGLCGCSSKPDPGASNAEFSHDIVLTMGLTVPAFTELHMCQFAALPSNTDVEAISFSHQYTPGSHHFLVIRTDLDAIPDNMQGQQDCTYGSEPIMMHARGVVYGGQTPLGHFPLPTGVGFHFAAKEVVILQTHYLNATANAVAAKVQFGIDTAPAATIRQEAGYMFFYDPFIYLPAQGAASSGLRCAVPEAIQIISASTHYHQRSTGMSVWLDEGGSQAQTPFFETHDWEHPPDFHGPLAVAAGSVVRFQCQYENPDPVEVFEGPNAKTSEMCVFGGLYYPKGQAAFENCQPVSVVGTGTMACRSMAACFQACSAGGAAGDGGGSDYTRTCREKCIAAGCDGAADATLRLVSCAQQACSAECTTAGANCDACLLAQCPSLVDACAQQACSP